MKELNAKTPRQEAGKDSADFAPFIISYKIFIPCRFGVLAFNLFDSSLAQPDRAGRRMGFDMTDADVPLRNAKLLCDSLAFAVEVHLGLPAGFREDFDVGPGDSAAPAGPQHLQNRLFRRKSARQVLVIPLTVAGTILLLRRRVDAIEEALAVLLDAAANSCRFDDIDAMPQDRHAAENIAGGRL